MFQVRKSAFQCSSTDIRYNWRGTSGTGRTTKSVKREYNHSSVIIVYAKKRAVFDLFSRII